MKTIQYLLNKPYFLFVWLLCESINNIQMTAEVDQSSRMISQLTQVRSKLLFKNVSLFWSVIFLEIEHYCIFIKKNNLLCRVRVRPRVVFLKKMTQRSGSTTQEYDERTHWTIVLLAHELFLLPLPPKSAVNFFCYSNVQPALRLSCKCCIFPLMVVFT